MKNFKITATLNERGDFYQYFGIHPKLACIYGEKPENIVEVEFKISEDQSIPPNDQSMNPDYWGWYDNDSKKFSRMIYTKHFLLEMCFPYGIKASEDKGQGKAYRLEIVLVHNYLKINVTKPE
jgi:hypothetical protein